MSAKIGCVSRKRYDEIVAEGRKLVRQKTSVQFRIGELALEIEPMRPQGGQKSGPGEELLTVSQALSLFADDIGLSPKTVEEYRFTAAHWPEEQRRRGVSFDVHRILCSANDPFELIDNPPDGVRWTLDEAKRAVGRRPVQAVSAQERVDRIHDLAVDDHVAARVATDFIRRPEVAARVIADDTARHLVNKAQIDRSKVVCENVRKRTPAVERVEHTAQFMELIGACAAFTAQVGRVIPTLRGHQFSADEIATVHNNVARVRATADWVETAVESGNLTLDEGFARLLRGE
ncbi:DUF6192 family protein [Nocardia sp. CDC160]|uniref:DUF6192 family protein n=1 Tax=Nocardia sp. CDC160 TaxID=3112166 RepID=UPI002DBC74AD|nr:DUF6192 family protein [Nocardia sp. CDC160]MEC3920282.1 DUF6192 family protein [Nocardia sp. CDC160]